MPQAAMTVARSTPLRPRTKAQKPLAKLEQVRGECEMRFLGTIVATARTPLAAAALVDFVNWAIDEATLQGKIVPTSFLLED